MGGSERGARISDLGSVVPMLSPTRVLGFFLIASQLNSHTTTLPRSEPRDPSPAP